MPQPDNGGFTALIELLHDELQAVGIIPPVDDDIDNSRDFARWFLATIELLERYVASNDAHQPMSRKEVELMCRCVLSASTLGQSFALIESFTEMLHPRAGKFTLSRTSNCLRVSLDSLRAQRTMASSLVDIAGLFAFKQLFHWLSAGRANCLQVGIGEIPRTDLMPFLLLFNVPVLAKGEALYLEYELSVETIEVVATAGEFEDFFLDFPCNLFEQRQPLEQQVSALIYAAVRQALPVPSQGDIAATLKLPLSTFRRKLSAGKHSFRKIRESCLHESAEHLLLRDELPIIDIAERLGFKDGDTFRNAFRRWTGLPPQRWRSEHRQKKSEVAS